MGLRGPGPFPSEGAYIGGGVGAELGYYRYKAFRGRAKGLGLEGKAGQWGGTAIINIDPNATPGTALAGPLSCLNATGWQLGVGPGGAVGAFGQVTETGVYELLGPW